MYLILLMMGGGFGGNKAVKDVSKVRSKTFPGIAEAMATQWGEYLINKLL